MMRAQQVRCISPTGFHRLAWVEWGDPDNPDVLVCVHALTRTGRDFDFLARELAGHYRVVCPDMPGRGRSDWLADKQEYGIPLYVSDIVTLLAALGTDSVDWIGTSMGGLIGMCLAALPDTPVRRLVLNDVGPVITKESLERISGYVGLAPEFASVEAAETYLREVNAAFGALSDPQWRHLAEHSVVQQADGKYRFHMDPGVGDSFRSQPMAGDMDLWNIYQAIRCPTLAIRGAQSDLLSKKTFQQMSECGPKAALYEVPDAGHAPALMSAAEISRLKTFLSD